MQEDTYRGDGLNLYAYCANNPVRYIDPSGHDKSEKKNDIQNQSDGDGINNIGSEMNTNDKEIPLLPGPVITGQNRLPGSVADTPDDGRRDEGDSEAANGKTYSPQNIGRTYKGHGEVIDNIPFDKASGIYRGNSSDPYHYINRVTERNVSTTDIYITQ